jgi:hypothetical protein
MFLKCVPQSTMKLQCGSNKTSDPYAKFVLKNI